MENSQNQAELILKNYLKSLNPKQSHVLPLNHLLTRVKWSEGEENIVKLKQLVYNNCPKTVRVDVI